MNHTPINLILGILLAFLPFTEVQSQVLRWTLENVRFDDGAQATGYFDFDPILPLIVDPDEGGFVGLRILRWNITVSGGNEQLFPDFTYDNSTSYAEASTPQPPDFPGGVIGFKALVKDLDGTRVRTIGLYLASPMTDQASQKHL